MGPQEPTPRHRVPATPGWERTVVTALAVALVLVVAVTGLWIATTSPGTSGPAPLRRADAAVEAAAPAPLVAGGVLRPVPAPAAAPAQRSRAVETAVRQRTARLARLAQREVATVGPTTVRIGTLNVLGSNHTRGSKRWAPGTSRSARQAGVITARGLDVIGLQEMQPDQIGVLQRSMPGYTMWPGTSLGPNGYRLQLMWRSAAFTAVETRTIATPFSGMVVPLPYVRLRDVATGQEFWVSVIHNSPRGMESERDRATQQEIGLFQQLLGTGVPVVTVGDMNEPSEFFCTVAPATGMVALNGARVAGGGCQVPRGSGIDWVMAGWRTGSITPSDYHREPLPGLSDHPIVWGDLLLTP